MQSTYALAELRWPIELGKVASQGRVCTPAHFESDTLRDWSLYLWLDKPMKPGESVTVPIMPLVSEAAEKLLRPGANFRLFIKPDLYAQGRIVTVTQTSEENLRCVFHFC